MRIFELDSALKRYGTELAKLEKDADSPSSEAILRVLIARDAVQVVLTDITQIPQERLLKVVQLDSRLQKQAGTINQQNQLADWCVSFNPPKEYWWWFLEDPTHKLDRFDWLWTALSITFLTGSLSLVVDISSRFFSGGLGIIGSFAVISQSALTLLTAGGVLTKAGRKGIEQALLQLGIKKYLWQETQLGLSLLLLLSLITFRSSLPRLADQFNKWGIENYQTGQLGSAQSNYELALSLDPDNAKAHYNLGILYEDLQEFDKARSQYRLAAKGNLGDAYSALARLYILNNEDNKYSEAISLIQIAQNGKEIEKDNQTESALWKNRGWIRLKQKDFDEAETFLREAIRLYNPPDSASAHCLLAQVLEGKRNLEKVQEKKALLEEEALKKWKICLNSGNPLYPEEAGWMETARKRIDNKNKEMP